MSNEVLTMCRVLAMKPVPKAVMNCLGDHANKECKAWPSIQTICAETGFRRSAVIEALNWLKGTGLIRADENPGRVSVYEFDLEALTRAHQDAKTSRSAGEPVRAVMSRGSPDGQVPVCDKRKTRSRNGPEASKHKESNTQATSIATARRSAALYSRRTLDASENAWLLKRNREAKVSALSGTALSVKTRRIVMPEGLWLAPGIYLEFDLPAPAYAAEFAACRPPYRVQRHWLPLGPRSGEGAETGGGT